MKTIDNSPENLYQMLEEKDRRIAELEKQVDLLIAQIRLGMHKKYGASSEQADLNQVSIFNEVETTADINIPEPELTEVKSYYRKRARLTTDKLPEDLPVEIVEHELDDEEKECPECGNEMHTMGKNTREELKIIPAKAVIVRHVCHTYSCRNCEITSDHVPIIKASMPEPVIKGGFASPETIAHIATQKFTMASPLYRQEQEWKQSGIWLSRQTMSNWLLKASNIWLEPLYELIRQQLLEHSVLHCDETTVQVLKEPGKAAQSKSYMWVYRTSGEAENQLVLYDYQPDRRYIRPREFLDGFSGYIHTDGYDAYHRLPDNIVVVGCFAHLRRKFFEAMKSLPKDKQTESNAARGVNYCDRLFKYEKQFVSHTEIFRKEERERLSMPLIKEFYEWVGSLGALPGSLLGKAVGYARSQQPYLVKYLEDGRLEISNNRAERSIKPFVIGRKNWLFANTPKGARASAIYYSLVITAIENGLNPFEYLNWMLTNAPNLGKSGYVADFSDFLPGSGAIPSHVFSPKPLDKDAIKRAWEEN